MTSVGVSGVPVGEYDAPILWSYKTLYFPTPVISIWKELLRQSDTFQVKNMQQIWMI